MLLYTSALATTVMTCIAICRMMMPNILQIKIHKSLFYIQSCNWSWMNQNWIIFFFISPNSRQLMMGCVGVRDCLSNKPPLVIFATTIALSGLVLICVSIYIETQQNHMINPDIKVCINYWSKLFILNCLFNYRLLWL